MRQLTGKVSNNGVLAAIIIFVSIEAIKIGIVVTVALVDIKTFTFIKNHVDIAEILFTVFWLMFDVTPLVALFWIHRVNFQAFDPQDLYLICEMTF